MRCLNRQGSRGRWRIPNTGWIGEICMYGVTVTWVSGKVVTIREGVGGGPRCLPVALLTLEDESSTDFQKRLQPHSHLHGVTSHTTWIAANNPVRIWWRSTMFIFHNGLNTWAYLLVGLIYGLAVDRIHFRRDFLSKRFVICRGWSLNIGGKFSL
jgi:hypothetical protein